MKRVLLLCLISMATLNTHAATINPPKTVQPYTAVVWTTTTLHSRAGKSAVFSQRTVYTRDDAGNVTRSIYRPTKGLQHDTTAPLGHVFTGTSSAQVLPSGVFSNVKVEQEADLVYRVINSLN